MEDDMEGRTQILEQLLREKEQNERAANMAKESEEKQKLQRTNTADVDSLSNSRKGQRIEKMLGHRQGKRRRKAKMEDIKAETARILEEFLQTQLEEQSVQTRRGQYQRYVEMNVTETTTPSGESTGYLASNSNYLRTDSIPYADESDHELRKAESLPHDEIAAICKQYDEGAIHHEKSKSAPHEPSNIIDHKISFKPPRLTKPTPPAPPGTPHSPSLQSSSDALSNKPVPYTGQLSDVSAKLSSDGEYRTRQSSSGSSYKQNDSTRRYSQNTSESAKTNGNRVVFTGGRDLAHDRSGSSTPKVPDSLRLAGQSLSSRTVTPFSASSGTGVDSSKSPTKKFEGSMSGFNTDSDSEGTKQSYAEGRKKKSLFKKAQERLSSFLRLHKHGTETSEDYEHSTPPSEVVKPKFKKMKKSKNMKGTAVFIPEDECDVVSKNSNDVIEEKDINVTRHIHQTHGGTDRRTLIRTEDSFEVIDQVSDDGRKHTEIHSKVKESSSGGGGFFGKHKLRFKSKKDKHAIKESQSAHWNSVEQVGGGRSYNRAVSVPGPGDRGTNTDHSVDLFQYGFSVTSVGRERHGDTATIDVTQVLSSEDVGDQSSPIDVVDHSSRPYIDTLLPGDGDGYTLPRNKSFDCDIVTHVHERHIRDANGAVRVVRDTDTHNHLELNGHAEGGATDITESEKDEIYGRIANRLATIGDHLMIERELEDSARSASTSPRRNFSSDNKTSPETEQIEKETLTPLERELRDELRRVADQLDERLARDACQAALRISGMMTYNSFKSVVQEQVGNEVGWNQLAVVFHLTKRAVEAAGTGGALALHIKELSLKYIEDRFAHWIVGQGGWDSMLSDDSETDSELD